MSRIIIFTGKGGTGKTSVASAHAVKAAQMDMKTLIVSTDMAHNLSDIFQFSVKNEPVEVIKNLWALEIDPNHEMEKYYGSIRDAVKKMITFSDSEKEETYENMVVFPGMEELFSLLKISELYKNGEYDLIIVDCAPTGETLSLLKFPELMSWYMEKLFPIGKIALKALRPVSKAVYKIEMPDSKAVNDIEKLYLRLSELEKLLKNRDVCSIRLVTIPEKMILEETKRSFMYLNMYNFNVDGVYINRLIPDNVDNKFFDKWKTLQKNYIEEIYSIFTGIPVYKIIWYQTDVNGVEGLLRIAEDSLNDGSIFKVQKITQNEIFEKTDKGYRLNVYVPCSDKNGFDLYEASDEIVIKLGNFKRDIPLPDVIRKYSVSKASMNEGYLSIYFEERVN